MKSYTRSHLTDQGLLSGFTSRLSLVHDTTAELLADLAEMEERKLFVRAAYSSMHLYCVHEFHMSEETAFKRMRAARAARKFPALYPALADGRLHLTAVVRLAPHLTPETVDELLDAASHKTKAEIELLLAERFPRPDVPTKVRAIAPADETELELSPGTVVPSSGPKPSVRMEPVPARSQSAPLSAERFEWHLTVSKSVQEKLRHAQELLGHAVPSGDLPKVLERALDALVEKLEKQKFAKTARPRPQKGPAKGRHIPAAVKRAVLERDGGQCTFVSEKGKRCEARARLEWDHLEPVARGGQATVAGIRLRCRAHNQYAAECAFGADFMRGKRDAARDRAAIAKAEAQADTSEEAKASAQAAAEAVSQEEVIPWLRALGCTIETARRAAARCAGMVGAPLEKRVRVAAQSLGPPSARRVLPVASSPA